MGKQKRLVLILVLLFLISGCTQPSGSKVIATATAVEPGAKASVRPVNTPTPNKSTITANIKSLDGIQIHFLQPWSGEMQDELYAMVDQFNQTNEWGVFVIMDSPGSAGAATQMLWDEIGKENTPNVVAAPISLLLAIDEKKELVADLEPYITLQKYGLEKALRDDFSALFWNEDNTDGKQYGIPAQRSATVMVYNSTWAKELGFDRAPSTPEEFQQQVCAANAAMRKDADVTNDGLGGWIINTSPAVLLNWLDAFGDEIGGSRGVQFNTPETKEAFTYLFALSRKACAWTGKTSQPYEYFSQRKTLVYAGQLQDVQKQARIMQIADAKDEWKVIPLPGVDSHPVVTSGFSYAILKVDSSKDLAAWLFIRWLSDPIQQARLLKASGTLPLGTQVMSQMADYSTTHPQWKQAVETLTEPVILPKMADWEVISPVLEDAGWQLFNSETKEDQIPAVIEQMDELVKELSERYP